MNGEDYRSRLYDLLNRESGTIQSDGVATDGAHPNPLRSGAGRPGGDPERENQESQPVTILPGAVVPKEKEGGKKKKKAKKSKKDEDAQLGSQRGVETLFRTSYATHMDLSALADNKANIMISINGIIVSVLLASISPKLDANPWLIVPTIMVLCGCIVSLTCAVFAALPRVSSKVLTLDDIRRSRGNLLFFGHFTRFSEQDYVQGMTELIQDPPRLYSSMMRDIYGLGNVLSRKFRLLRVSYVTFLVGLILGVFMFVIVYIGIARMPPPVQQSITQQPSSVQTPGTLFGQ